MAGPLLVAAKARGNHYTPEQKMCFLVLTCIGIVFWEDFLSGYFSKILFWDTFLRRFSVWISVTWKWLQAQVKLLQLMVEFPNQAAIWQVAVQEKFSHEKFHKKWYLIKTLVQCESWHNEWQPNPENPYFNRYYKCSTPHSIKFKGNFKHSFSFTSTNLSKETLGSKHTKINFKKYLSAFNNTNLGTYTPKKNTRMCFYL